MVTTSRSPQPDLTPREIEVLRRLGEGLTTKQIAGKLSISFKTAATHRYHLLDKTGCTNTVLLVRWAIRKA